MPTPQPDDPPAEWQEAHAGERDECIRAALNMTPNDERLEIEVQT